MYPLPVLSYKDYKTNELELHNYKLTKKISKKHKKMIIESSSRKKIGDLSLARSKFLEGRVMARADKIASTKQLECMQDATALITGKNKRLIK